MSQAYRLRPGSFNAQIGLDETAEAVTDCVRQLSPTQNTHRNNPFAEIQQVEAINRANRQRMNGERPPRRSRCLDGLKFCLDTRSPQVHPSDIDLTNQSENHFP
jgi:hypothetical protein